MGRNRKTREEHELSGTISKHPEYKHYGSSRDIALPPSVNIRPNSRYQKETKEAWKMVIEPLQSLRVLTELDLPLLASMFDIYDSYIVASKTADELRKKLDPDDRSTLDALLKAEDWKRKSFESFSRTASKFGLDPSNRTRLEIPEPEEVDPLTALGL